MRRATILIVIIITALTLGRTARAQKSADVSESYAKAVAIYNFTKLVDWPATAFPAPESPVIICVLGDDPFAAELGQSVDGKKVNGRKLVSKKIKWSKDIREFKDCNMLYIASAESAHGDEVIQALKGTPVLTIADFPDFAKHGGIINFFLEDSTLRFAINVESAKQSDLAISSRLLSLSKITPTGSSWR